ncbi:MAG TPA: VIT domain-containing protein, partial [Thermoanaerobaculia bacterium]|nr:VIT domain-containing protein [Thermoanaerobaculia bacterium]
MRHLRPWLVAALLVGCHGCPARLLAQDDHAAGLFAAARQLPLVGQSMTVRLEGGDAVVELVQIFANDGAAAAQADYRLHLPSGATVAGFGFWRDGRFLAATLAERGQARAAHARAAEEGRATGLLQRDGEVHSFSVYPLAAHGVQQVALTLRLPVVTERGRSHVRLPLDELLGDSPVSCTVVAVLRTPQPLAAFGADGASFLLRGRGPRWAELVLTSEQPVELWWSEQGPPLLAAAEAVPLEDGTFAVQLRLQLNRASEALRAHAAAPGADAGPRLVGEGAAAVSAEATVVPAPRRDLVLLIDGSFSMRRRAATVAELVTRLVEAPARARPRSLRLIAVGERTAELTPAAPEELPRALRAADVG